jgi:DHA1 family inner membrane transport protein
MTEPPAPHDHLVHDAFGPAISGIEAGATIGVGMNSLLVLGVMPVLLGALADEHRLSAADIGLAAMLELFGMGVATALAGMALKLERLKTIGVIVSIALAAVDLATTGASGAGILALRTAAGGLEGILLWITVGMITRTITPERWAGVFFTAQTLIQLLLAVILAVWIMPGHGANGGYGALAVASLLGVAPALASPSRLAALPVAPGASGAPPRRGWIALIGTVIYVAAGGALAVYLEPLAHQAGLSANVARTALWTSLVAQVVGAAAATALAGKLRYFTVFMISSAIYLGVWCAFAFREPAWLFVSVNALAGLGGLFLAPFQVPMMIAADPSRRAAMQSGAAQLVGGALGPLLASQVVSDSDAHGVLWLGCGLLLAGLSVIAWLRFTTKADAAPL